MTSGADHNRILHWTKRRWVEYELCDSIFPLASLKLSLGFRRRIHTGTYRGKKIEVNETRKGFDYYFALRIEGEEKDWGTFQASANLNPPAVLSLSDGRVYKLVPDKWNKFRLSSKNDRTVLVTTFELQNEFKSYVEIFNITENDPDHLLLALASFLPILFFNGQNSAGIGML
jgi:hypothetical protein